MNNTSQTKIIAGTDLRAGQVLYVNVSDGKAYPVQFYSIKYGKIGEKPTMIAGENIPKDELGIVFTAGQMVVYRSRHQSLKRSIRRLWYRLRGKHYPYMD